MMVDPEFLAPKLSTIVASFQLSRRDRYELNIQRFIAMSDI